VAKSFLTSHAVVIEHKVLQPITLPSRKAMATPDLGISKDRSFSKGPPMSKGLAVAKDLAMSKGHFIISLCLLPLLQCFPLSVVMTVLKFGDSGLVLKGF